MIRTFSRNLAFLLPVAGFIALTTGCGGPKTIASDSPQATAQGFIDAIKAGDFDLAATAFDYATSARQQNPDWDTFAPQQRKEIVQKLQERKASELQALSGMLAEGVQVGQASTQGTQAIVPVTAGATTIQLYMSQQDGRWYIRRIQEGAAR